MTGGFFFLTGTDEGESVLDFASFSMLSNLEYVPIKLNLQLFQREQQRLVSAILAMADQLDLQTLAESVESHGEHSMLAQLGCGHVQGRGVALPLPFEGTMAWMDKHSCRIGQPPRIGRPTQ